MQPHASRTCTWWGSAQPTHPRTHATLCQGEANSLGYACVAADPPPSLTLRVTKPHLGLMSLPSLTMVHPSLAVTWEANSLPCTHSLFTSS